MRPNYLELLASVFYYNVKFSNAKVPEKQKFLLPLWTSMTRELALDPFPLTSINLF